MAEQDPWKLTASIRVCESSFFCEPLPEPSDWQCDIAGLRYVPEKGKEPNRFHRFMQQLAFGFRWRRREGR